VKLTLPAALQAQMEQEARAAAPRECCGLIEGALLGEVFEAHALHPARNEAAAPDRFAIAAADHFAAARAARGNGRCLIGCYHSHPAGAPEPSRHDAAGAGEENFLWLIAGGADCRLAAFVYRSGAFEPVSLGIGAVLVTSSLNERN
jgi:proteasome lid subunit RPN8/RPN11